MSVTSVLYLKDEVSIATAGAADRWPKLLQFICKFTQHYLYYGSFLIIKMLLYCSVVKFWDTRNLKAPVTQACSRNNPDDKRKSVCLHVGTFAKPYISIGSLVPVATKYTSF